MNKEIEYKYTVVSDSWRSNAENEYFVQGYLCSEQGRTVRIRLEGKDGKITVKGKKKGPEGSEFEYTIPAADAEFMLNNLCIKPLIRKTRFFVQYAGKNWVIDEFEGENSGLLLAEIELNDADEQYELPPWAGSNVTDDPKYKNANLVTYPFNKWSASELKEHFQHKA